MTGKAVGQKVPKFETTTSEGVPISSGSLLGKRWVLYFYPKDLTPGCINQACSMRDSMKAFEERNVLVFGVSMDNARLHERFTEKYQLNFPLLMDENKRMIRAFKVWGPKKFMGREYDGIHRTTFVVNEKGVITHIIDKPKTKIHADEVIACLDEKKMRKKEERK